MKTMIAYCGLNCETCPIHLATIEQDPTVQLEWYQIFQFPPLQTALFYVGFCKILNSRYLLLL